ncbi:MAG: DEAD/DEAH box helicase [Sedimentisphaerales bacterium]|nr:DEAD/DEAH box helicase [Sedimentisphaerales bacterium]
MKFTDLNLKPKILAALRDMQYIDLTPVQEKTFPHVLSGRDIIAKAETGSGKTAACAVPIIQMVNTSLKAVQALVLVPTRELALQYVGEISDIARRTNIAPSAVYGGFPIQIQTAKLNHGVEILVATPGRLIDLLRNTKLSLSNVRTFVLDEADEMLNMGFISDVEFIINCLIHEHQTLLFSATMPKEISKLAQKYLKDPLTIDLSKDQAAPQNLQHFFMQVNNKNRLESLLRYMNNARPKQAIIFCNSRIGAEKLHGHLKKKLSSTEIIHGGLDQSRRTSLFNRFRKMEIKIMVATALASRGLDFTHATHVINYDFPADTDAYTHRTGRTARMGREGVALTFFTKRDLNNLKTIINTNRIQPIWQGAEPDLMDVPRPHKSRKRSSRNYRPRRRKQQGGSRTAPA